MNPLVPSMMIEINRKLYLKDGPLDTFRYGDVPLRTNSFDKLKNDILDWMLFLVRVGDCVMGGRV